MTLSAREIIRKEYGQHSRNFMTPSLIRFGKIHPRRAYELSWGIGFSNNKIFGVSIVDVSTIGTTTRRTDLSDCFPTQAAAEAYIDRLKSEA